MYANAAIFSYEIIDALYGTLIKLIEKVNIENCNTQFVASILSEGITK